MWCYACYCLLYTLRVMVGDGYEFIITKRTKKEINKETGQKV